MKSDQVWQSTLYDQKMDFVSEYGKNVVELLRPVRGERIVDLGCGTGDLAHEIAKTGASVVGLDLSPQMIAAARLKYPQLDFRVADAASFSLEWQYDAVFSNAALHWVKEPDRVVAKVWNALKSEGRFVAEFGGHGNVGEVVQAIVRVLIRDYEIDADRLIPWYFPTIGQYSTILERQGFRVAYAIHFDRPTIMPDGEHGLRTWLASFAESFFASMANEQKEAAIRQIENEARDTLYIDGAWHLDYKRLRVIAIKPVE